jgi:hypothetical protein
MEMNLMSRARGTSLAALVGLQLVAGAPLAALAAVTVSGHDPDVARGWTARIGAPALTIPAGTDIPVTVDETIALKADQIGKTFPAHVTRNVVVNGAVAIRAGAPAQVVLVESPDTPGAASFRVTRISIGGRMRPVRTDVARGDTSRSGLSTGKKAGIGAVAGGVLGLVTGGGGGLLKGAAVGAGGGLAWGLLDKGTNEVKADTPLAFSLSQPIRVS